MKVLYLLIILLGGTVFSSKASDNYPNSSTEIRAVWFTTNWKLDWPKKGKSVEEQKKELTDILDELQQCKFNLVLFQARAQGAVFYNSQNEPKSKFFNHEEDFDPLAFAIEECHKRQMECHAWLTTFPVERIQKKATRPSYYKSVKGHWYWDPARPETEKNLVNIIREITENYNIDGIHLDYIRYPDNQKWINDSDSYKKYGVGCLKNDWRRNNVNRVVETIYNTVKSIKPWVQVSSSPIGKYKRIHENDKWTAYDDVFQDPINWIENGKQDIIFPMMYYKLDDFKRHYDYWVEHASDRYVVPGLGLYKLDEDWNLNEILDEIDFLREKNSSGIAFFRTDQVLKNENIKDYLKQLYAFPAKLPPLVWLTNQENISNPNLYAFLTKEKKLKLFWTNDTHSEYTYNIYVSKNRTPNMDDPKELLITNYRGNSLELDFEKGEYGLYYFITSNNRYHMESELSESVFFVHSNTLFK